MIRTRTSPITVLALLALVLAMTGGCGKLPPDEVGAQMMHFDKVRNQRYAEIFLIVGNPLTKEYKAGVYNTIGLNSPNGSGDSAPQALVSKIDVDAIKQEFGVLRVHKNGPRLWALDWIDIKVGKQREFNGLQARWVMLLDVPKELVGKESVAYKKITGNRDTNFGFDKGKPVFVLDDPEGNSWVMKSIDIDFAPDQTYDSLQTLGNRLKPPAGWKYRVAMLDKDLVLTPDQGKAMILRDELGNTYDRTGGAYSNFKP